MATASLTAYSKSPPVVPTALAISQLQDEIQISVGLENGRFSLFVWNIGTSDLRFQSSHMCCNDGAITAMALSSPYLLIVSQHKDLTLYDLCHGSQRAGKAGDIQEPHQLASLRAENIVAPMTLSLRVSSFDLVATIVYSFFHTGCGWSLGIQELRLGKDGQQLDSRLTTTVDSQYGLRPPRALSQSQERWYSATQPMNNQSLVSETPAILHQKPPTSMSYSHPYLLTSHADNTLTMYLVVSTSDKLFVQGGRRLWGHTSSVSAVQVTNRGKAVSVSARGDEIRIWELEMAISTLGSRKCFKEENGVQLNPENKQDEGSEIAPVHHNLDNVDHNQGLLQNCVGFDEERVLLLRDKTGTQLLGCYDFT
jgi:hypothetical protein